MAIWYISECFTVPHYINTLIQQRHYTFQHSGNITGQLDGTSEHTSSNTTTSARQPQLQERPTGAPRTGLQLSTGRRPTSPAPTSHGSITYMSYHIRHLNQPPPISDLHPSHQLPAFITKPPNLLPYLRLWSLYQDMMEAVRRHLSYLPSHR